MRRLLLLLALAASGAASPLGAPSVHAEELPSAEELLQGIDRNLQFESRTSTTRMVVDNGRRSREYVMKTFARGQDEAAIEYLEPVREKGTRMLKKGDELWIFMPSVERVQKLSGHMLRQGMMGSDVSYEDMLAASDFADMYDAKVVGAEELDGRPVYRVELNAKDTSVTYPRRVTWVDAETFIPLRQELYALSGMLVKTWTMSDVKEFEGGRKFPTKMEIADQLQKGSRTTLVLEDLSFGVVLEDEVFSMRWLERGG